MNSLYLPSLLLTHQDLVLPLFQSLLSFPVNIDFIVIYNKLWQIPKMLTLLSIKVSEKPLRLLVQVSQEAPARVESFISESAL